MNREETKHAIEVMQAYVDGAEIEWSLLDTDDWLSCDDKGPDWDWDCLVFRVKAKPREWWLNNFDGVDVVPVSDEFPVPPGTHYVRVREVLDDA